MPGGNGLSPAGHIVALMRENCSFDHMLGFLSADRGNTCRWGSRSRG